MTDCALSIAAAVSKVLLTGDARSDHILAGLEEADLLRQGKYTVDVLKMPHHGSNRNIDAEFFKRVRAKCYIISGDGKHGNPDPETFEMLAKARDSQAYKVLLTYGIDELEGHDEFDKVAMQRLLNRNDTLRRSIRSKRAGELGVRVTL